MAMGKVSGNRERPGMKEVLTPEGFWEYYKEYLRKHGSLKAWKFDRIWTKLALEAAEHACRKFDYCTQREFLRLDVIGYEGPDPDCDWHLRVAYEHENSSRWREELCKLVHVVADLRVLATFYDNDKGEVPMASLGEAVGQLGDRMARVPGAQWLFIFGPRKCDPSTCFVALTVSDAHTIILIPDRNPLHPDAWYQGTT